MEEEHRHAILFFPEVIELHQYINDNNLEGVKKMCEKYPQYINVSNPNGGVAITLASCIGNIDIVKCLLEYGANPNIYNSGNYNALYLASGENHLEVVKVLLQYGAHINDISQAYRDRTPLMMACINNNKDIIKYLCKHGGEIYLDDKSSDEYFIIKTLLELVKVL